MRGPSQRGALRASAVVGLFAGLLALCLVVAAGYMFVTTAGSPPPARPSAKPQPPPEPPKPPVAEEVKEYVANVDAIMRAREITLQALAETVTLGGARELAVEEAMSITVRRRETTKDALDALLQLEPPPQAAQMHNLYVKLLTEDVTLTDQTVGALRAGDAAKAAQFVQTRDARMQKAMDEIRQTAKVLGVQ